MTENKTITCDYETFKAAVIKALKAEEEHMDCDSDFGGSFMEKVVNWKNYAKVVDTAFKELNDE